MDATSVLTDAIRPIGEWLLVIAGAGIAIASLVFLVRLAWDVVLDFVGGSRGGASWGHNPYADEDSYNEDGQFR